MITTMDMMPGTNCKVLGLVKGSSIQSRNIGRDIGQGLKSLVGGELKDYTELMNRSRDIATQRMVEDAERMGADAIVAMRYATSSIESGAAEVLAYGTAVRLI